MAPKSIHAQVLHHSHLRVFDPALSTATKPSPDHGAIIADTSSIGLSTPVRFVLEDTTVLEHCWVGRSGGNVTFLRLFQLALSSPRVAFTPSAIKYDSCFAAVVLIFALRVLLRIAQ